MLLLASVSGHSFHHRDTHSPVCCSHITSTATRTHTQAQRSHCTPMIICVHTCAYTNTWYSCKSLSLVWTRHVLGRAHTCARTHADAHMCTHPCKAWMHASMQMCTRTLRYPHVLTHVPRSVVSAAGSYQHVPHSASV